MAEPAKKSSPLASVSGIAAAMGGWSLSHYCGASIWIPGAAIILFLLLFTKSPIRPRYFAGAIATTAAHITWFIIGSAITGIWSATVLDIIALGVGIVWLWARPGLIAVLFLGLVQVASLGFNVYRISSMPFGSAPHRALTAHCAFRLIAILCLVVGYLRLRRERSAAPVVPAVVTL